MLVLHLGQGWQGWVALIVQDGVQVGSVSQQRVSGQHQLHLVGESLWGVDSGHVIGLPVVVQKAELEVGRHEQ